MKADCNHFEYISVLNQNVYLKLAQCALYLNKTGKKSEGRARQTLCQRLGICLVISWFLKRIYFRVLFAAREIGKLGQRNKQDIAFIRSRSRRTIATSPNGATLRILGSHHIAAGSPFWCYEKDSSNITFVTIL